MNSAVFISQQRFDSHLQNFLCRARRLFHLRRQVRKGFRQNGDPGCDIF
jgi:hypothetical protein